MLALAANPVRSGNLDQALAELSARFLSSVPIAYFSTTGIVLGATQFDPASLVPLAGSEAVSKAQTRGSRSIRSR